MQLIWKIDTKGNQYADALIRRYTVAYEAGFSPRWQVRVDGYPIGQGATEDAAKAIAQRHSDRDSYSPTAVDNAIASSNRAGRHIGAAEAKAIHALLRGKH
jgi:hypothetical protein